MRTLKWLVIGAAIGSVAACGTSSSGGNSNSDKDTPVVVPGDDTTNPGDTVAPGEDVPTLADTTEDKPDVCTPFCQPGWECGPDGCDGTCGTCPDKQVCNNAKHTCKAPVEPPPDLKKYGEQCGRKGDCQPTILDTVNGGYIQNPDWPACIAAQCETGRCLEPSCTKDCEITSDKKDWQGNPNGDGVEDADAATHSCDGAADGPMGTKWNCVMVTSPDQGNPVSICLPGTTFKPCAQNADCPTGESCQLQAVLGEYSLRCSGAPKGKNATASQNCNENPDDGEINFCDTNMCFGLGCTDFCAEDAQCYTFASGKGCVGGKCKDGQSCTNDQDCSSWLCRQDYKIYSDLEQTFDLCWPKNCKLSGDCPDKDFFCAQNFNGEYDGKEAWEHLCIRKPDGDVAKLGEECEDNPDDNIPKPKCGENDCIGGVCSSICNTDEDCAGAASPMLCYWVEYTLDYTPDDASQDTDGLLPLGRCFPYPGSQKPCQTDKDCGGAGALEACTFLETKNADGVFDAKTVCSAVDVADGDEGDACGADTGVQCKSGLCLGSGNGNPGYCSKLCTSSADCGKGISLGQFSGTYSMACFPILLGNGGTLSDDSDNVYVAACAPLMPAGPDYIAILTDQSSMEDCSDDYKCKAGETCLGVGIGSGATGDTKLEMLCVSQSDTQGNTADKDLGAQCTLDPADQTEPYVCKSLYCLPDSKTNVGYCSQLCATNDDCTAGGPDMVCDQYTLLDRKDDSKDISIGLCRKEKSCIACKSDNDCTGNYVCVNAGGLDLLEDRRCAPPCTEDADCTGTDGGSKCEESADKKGKPEGKKACIPSKC